MNNRLRKLLGEKYFGVILMKSNIFKFLSLLLLFSFLLSACSSITTPEADADATLVPIVADDFAVTAEGQLVPKDSVWLSFVTSGQVEEVLVEEGDPVRTGDLIARLGDREALESSIAMAELEVLMAELDLVNAQQDLDAIYENWPAQATQAQEALTNARQVVHDTEKRLGYMTSSASEADIDLAWTQVVLAKDALDKAEERFEPYEDKPSENLTRAAFQSQVAKAQKAYDEAVRRYNALVSDTSNEFDISQTEDELAIAQARLKQAQEDYDILKDGPDPDDIAAAERRIASAEGRIETANATLTAAQVALDNLELTATIDGTVIELDLIEGQQVTPGETAVLVADFSEWYVETDNLTEIEVVDVGVNQPVNIVPDALQDFQLSGVVTSISNVFEEKRGDITYTARILLDESDPRLRWGMTVVVTFEK